MAFIVERRFLGSLSLNRYLLNWQKYFHLTTTFSSATDDNLEEKEFRKLELQKKRAIRRRRDKLDLKAEIIPPRYQRLPMDEPWMNVWPTAQTFRPSVIPLPIRQGFTENRAPPNKFANAELMKIPNFFHLTPPAIRKHCEAISQFCTPWPKQLKTDEICEKHFPVEYVTSDYCRSSPTIRDPKARIVTLKIKVSSLNLDYHACDKLLRLVGERYDPKTDILSIVAERCPLRQQNKDYANYLLTALFYESWKVQPWESEKTEADMEKYFWENSLSQKKVIDIVSSLKENTSYKDNNKNQESSYVKNLPDNYDKEDILTLNEVKNYSEALVKIRNECEDETALQKYKDAVLKLLDMRNKVQNREMVAF